jgi:2-oxoglutarate ferredoxin oxidoreductase subunit beta
METLDEMGLLGKAIGVAPIGCSVVAHQFMNVDMCESAHGRAPAIASGIRRVHPDKVVFTYQGDGDLACIGACETIHALNRGEHIVIIFINNAIYGMTGGQMAPTTLLGQKTATCPYGRRVDLNGYPLSITPLLAQLDGTCYVTRQAVHTPAAVRKAKRAIEQAFRNSMEKRGTSVVEIVSTCNSGWKLTPEKANQWMAEHMFEKYPLGDIKNIEKT